MPRASYRWLGLASIVAVILPVVLAGTLWTGPPAVRSAPAPGPVPPSPVVLDGVDISNVTLTISPGSWTLAPGGSVGLVTGLGDVPSGCSPAGESYLWTVVNAWAPAAYLNASSGPDVTVTALPNASGNFWVQAELTTMLLCPSGEPDFSLESEAEIELVPFLSVGSVTLTTLTATPGSAVGVSWDATGGQPPYTVTVAFGDGNATTLLQTQAGPGEVWHDFGPGQFYPEVEITDARGTTERSGPVRPLNMEWGLTVAMAPTSSAPELGRPFVLNASVSGGRAPYYYEWTVDGNSSDVIWTSQLTLRPSSLAPLQVELFVTSDGGGMAWLNATFNVTPAPNLTVRSFEPFGDVGLAFPVNVSLGGGEGPFNLTWRVLPGGANDSEILPSDGTFVVPLVPAEVGELYAAFAVTDAVGGLAGGSYTLGDVGLPPTVAVATPSAPAEAGVPVDLELRVGGGTPPYRWTVEPSRDVTNASALSGSVGAAGEVNWSGTPAGAGNFTVEAVVLDTLGGLANATATVAVAPALTLDLGVANGSASSAGSATLDLDVEGGIPPYELAVREAGVVAAYENLSGPGPVRVTLQVPSSGYVTFAAQVEDALGVVRDRTVLSYVAAPAAGAPTTSPPSPTPTPSEASVAGPGDSWSLLALGALGVGVLVLVVRDRRRRPSNGPGDRPAASSGPAMEFVRRTLADGEGLDAETLVLLAEEEGIPEASLRAALGRWERAGRLRREPDGTGSELLAWRAGAPLGASGAREPPGGAP